MLGLGNLFAQPRPMSVSSVNVPLPSVIPLNSLLPSHTPRTSSSISLFESSITDLSAHWSRPLILCGVHVSPYQPSIYLHICLRDMQLARTSLPNVHSLHLDPLVMRTLSGMKKLQGRFTPCFRCPMSEEDLDKLFSQHDTDNYDDCLFMAIILSSFHTLLRIRELTQPDSLAKCSFVKLLLFVPSPSPQG